ncbi:MAG: adenylate/guanylate cyclase domain-containing protein [Deltaproteobacteria bacterium]|nr:adenylate/guanylate cyclase domain-containing protein [Deltaproteobacteria bacterium]
MTRSHEETFDVALPRDRVWAVMADTQHLNQLFFGLEATNLVSRDGDKARLRGTFGFFAPEYDEYPWSFDVPRHYKNVRVFTKGVLDRLETECRLEDGDNGNTRVRYTLNVTGKGLFGAIAARVVISRLRQGLAAARAMLETMARALPAAAGSAQVLIGGVQWPPANPQREVVLARARGIADDVAAGLPDAEKAVLEQLVMHVADGADADIARMRPYVLADEWSAPRKDTLLVFLRAAKSGLLRLSWDVLCPSCEGATTVESLKDLPAGGHCPACDIDFTTGFEQNVEATFRPEPQVRQAERLVFCHGSPASTKAWLAQFVVEPKQSHTLKLHLGLGRYRLQAAGVQRPSLLDVKDEGAAEAKVTLTREGNESTGGLRFPAQLPTMRAGEITLVIENSDDKAHRVQLAHRAFASGAATAADVVSLNLFRELFGREVLSPDQHVGVGQMAILFTDLVGSTAMYERVGDAGAYGLVREHFKLLFKAIENHHGRVVKTVGDCVMAAFDLPSDATRAGFECIAALRTLRDSEGNKPGVRLKVGVHTGSCLAVEANDNIDYFGRTVNIAARVESLANPDELVLSWAVMAAPDVKGIVGEFEKGGHSVRSDQKKVKGIEGDVEVVRIAVKEDG